ncbi:MAG: hypothetical protein LBT89_04085, partial [Planctomycetaceae bacterium]|nr:hypothetical protein [Planctomycetaceae bacterium]
MLKTRFAFLSVILIIGFVSPPVYGQGYPIMRKILRVPYTPIIRPTIKHFLPEKEIVRLAECAKYPGKLGEEVGK